MRGGDWIILTCGKMQTLQLARSLGEADYDVWAPADTRQRWAGRPRKLVDQAIAIIPGLVFARAIHLGDMLALSNAPSLTYNVWDSEKQRMVTKGHPYFRVFRDANGPGRVMDRDLAGLRQYEQDKADQAARRKRSQRQGEYREQLNAYDIGDEVKITDGPFQGCVGIVSTIEGKCLAIDIPNFKRVIKISPWHLQSVQLNTVGPEQGIAAQAA